MPLEQAFLREQNFQLALERVSSTQDAQYSTVHLPLLNAYRMGAPESSRHLMNEIRRGSYQPSAASLQFHPKAGGGLRPISHLTIRDQHAYQAIANVIGDRVRGDQAGLAYRRRFASILAPARHPALFYPWRVGYRAYGRRNLTAFRSGYEYRGQFDLVSFYDTIDHTLLMGRLARYVSDELRGLLTLCLQEWSALGSRHGRGFGVPQGPEASGLLAELFLFDLDRLKLGDVIYSRYVDDVTVLGKSPEDVHQALLLLEIAARRMGLTPKPWRDTIERLTDENALRARVPSHVLQAAFNPDKLRGQKDLRTAFRDSVEWRQRKWVLRNASQFRFALLRLNPRKDFLRIALRIVEAQPDLSWVVGEYAQKFKPSADNAAEVARTMRARPAYSMAIGDLARALGAVEPKTGVGDFRAALKAAVASCAESGPRAEGEALRFYVARRPNNRSTKLLRAAHPLAAASALELIATTRPQRVAQLDAFLGELTEGADADLAVYAASLMLPRHKRVGGAWNPSRRTHPAVQDLLFNLGLRGRRASRPTVLARFFEDTYAIQPHLSWRKALGPDLIEAERRCLRFQDPALSDPSARILALNVFNELLVRRFSAAHPTLSAAYQLASAGGIPDYGSWVRNGPFLQALRAGGGWFQRVHLLSRESELPHAQISRGARAGQRTRPVRQRQLRQLLRDATTAWTDLIHQWDAFL
ncbi:MAG: reverse transcriptase domain-containing protein [Dehalococcoidia bacterium]